MPPSYAPASTIDRRRLRELAVREDRTFAEDHPRCLKLVERGLGSMPGGVPMPWMKEVASPFPLFVDEAEGAHITCVDGRTYVDLCLGDTGSMAGHSPKPVLRAIERRAARGLSFMLPTEDSVWVAEELGRRFGLPRWQFCLSATDANRFVLRLSRAITRRPKILVFNYCYHGTVDETFATLRPDGTAGIRPGMFGEPVDPALTTKVVEFNDVAALEHALAPGDVACVLAEPAMTNVGIVLPEPGFHDALRTLTREQGTLLVIDETHTISEGPGGSTRARGLDPDLITIGKPIGGGVPSAAYGMTAAVSERMQALHGDEPVDADGIGGTLAANALSLAAMRATLEHVLTPEAYERMLPLGDRWADGVQRMIDEHGAPWSVTRLGARAEYWCSPAPPVNGGRAQEADDTVVDRYLHLACLNRGIFLTPFHNMALMSPATTERDVDSHTAAFGEVVSELLR
jgi:glutamate-1-semialdehyde 2,1-aminomutase